MDQCSIKGCNQKGPYVAVYDKKGRKRKLCGQCYERQNRNRGAITPERPKMTKPSQTLKTYNLSKITKKEDGKRRVWSEDMVAAAELTKAINSIGRQGLADDIEVHVSSVNKYIKRMIEVGHKIPSVQGKPATRSRSRTEESSEKPQTQSQSDPTDDINDDMEGLEDAIEEFTYANGDTGPAKEYAEKLITFLERRRDYHTNKVRSLEQTIEVIGEAVEGL